MRHYHGIFSLGMTLIVYRTFINLSQGEDFKVTNEKLVRFGYGSPDKTYESIRLAKLITPFRLAVTISPLTLFQDRRVWKLSISDQDTVTVCGLMIYCVHILMSIGITLTTSRTLPSGPPRSH